MRHYPIERRRAAVAVYRLAAELKELHGPRWLSPLHFAQTAAGGASSASVYDWLGADLSVEANEDAEETRGRRRTFSEDQEQLLVGFAVSSRSALLAVDLDKLTHFSNSHLSATPSLSTLSRIMSSHGLSSQRTLGRNSRMVSEEVVEDSIAMIETLRGYDYPPGRLLFMDETGLWSNVVQPKTYHFRNWSVIALSLKICRFSESASRTLPCPTAPHGLYGFLSDLPVALIAQEQRSCPRTRRQVPRHSRVDSPRRWKGRSSLHHCAHLQNCFLREREEMRCP